MDTNKSLLESNTAYWTLKKIARQLYLAESNDLKPIRKIHEIQGIFSNFLFHHKQQLQLKELAKDTRLFIAGKPKNEVTLNAYIKDSISAAQNSLQELKRKQMSRLCFVFNLPMIRRRTDNEGMLIMNDKEGGLSNVYSDSILQYDGVPSKITETKDFSKAYVYNDMDLYANIKSIHINNRFSTLDFIEPCMSSVFNGFWSAVSIPVQTLSIEKIAEYFKELHPSNSNVGFTDLLDETSEKFILDRLELGKFRLNQKSIIELRQYCKHGCPNGIRASIWDATIQSDLVTDLKEHSQHVCLKLKSLVAKYHLLVDQIILMDVKQCQNDDSFFVFEELLNQVMLFWTRDEWIYQKLNFLENQISLRKFNVDIDRWNMEIDRYPSNGIYPFYGISSYAMPICFIHSSSESIYITFRELYTRYFYHLHNISDGPKSIINLLITFENLLKEKDATLFYHLNYTLEVEPLSIAYRWIVYAFVGVLEPDQVLLLWDRMIGYDGCLIFSVLAAAIFLFRRNALMMAKNKKEVMNAFNDLSMLKVVPVLQMFIFNLDYNS